MRLTTVFANQGKPNNCLTSSMENHSQSQTTGNRAGTPLWTCAEGAAFLGLSRSAFWNKCRNREIPHIRLSRRAYRVRLSDLEAYLAERSR
jgi:excisionase family DNA binding protein